MQLELTKEQFREMLKAVITGVQIREAVGEERNTPGWEKIIDIEGYLLSIAKDFDAKDMAECFEGFWIPTDKVSEELDEELEEYNNQEFWNRLVTDFGQRDFYRTITKEDKKYIKENHGIFPPKMHELYNKYSNELEEHGLERLEIVEKGK